MFAPCSEWRTFSLVAAYDPADGMDLVEVAFGVFRLFGYSRMNWELDRDVVDRATTVIAAQCRPAINAASIAGSTTV
ncbi:hypothetical protein [Mycobacterium sp.]|uniref:hypothetical protein n=1 Tax=Mycobacterium sp. TaxID=1785 RepID=UPI003BAB561C